MKVNRRGFMAGGVVGAATAAIGLIRFTAASPTAAAVVAVPGSPLADMAPMAGMPGMDVALVNPTTYGFEYQGHSVRMTETPDAAMLVIDGRHPIHLERPGIGEYHTHLLPFSTYTNRNTLVRDVLGAAGTHLFII